MGRPRSRTLELQAKGELTDASGAGRCRKHSEVRIGDIGVPGRWHRRREAGVVEDVEEVGTELQVDVAIAGDIEDLVES